MQSATQQTLVQLLEAKTQIVDMRIGDGPSQRVVQLALTVQAHGSVDSQQSVWYTLTPMAAARLAAQLAQSVATALHPESTGPSATAH